MVKKVVEQIGRDNLVVITGAPDAESAELYATTLIEGDPSWVGPLAGISLKLPVYHILEPEIKKQIDPAVYKHHLELMDIAMDIEQIAERLKNIREKHNLQAVMDE